MHLTRLSTSFEHPASIAEGNGGVGLQVICLDNLFTGSKQNIAHLLHHDNFEVIRHDVVNPILLEVDQIFHLACPASPIHYKCVHSPS